ASDTSVGVASVTNHDLVFLTNSTLRGSIDTSGNFNLINQGDIRLYDADSSHYVGFQAPTAVTTSVAWTLPAADSSGCFQSNGAGTVSIGACGMGGGSGVSIGDAIGSATPGSVLFANSSSQLAQDNANLFWDDANDRLGLGANSSLKSILHIQGTV